VERARVLQQGEVGAASGRGGGRGPGPLSVAAKGRLGDVVDVPAGLGTDAAPPPRDHLGCDFFDG